MIFEALYDASKRGELLLVEGGICHYHLRRNGQLTIREIISTRPGAGQAMLARLKQVPGATRIFAKCPRELQANDWYRRNGFSLEGTDASRRGRLLNLWVMYL